MSKQVSIPDGLYSQLSVEAQKNNVPVETLAAQLLESALAKPTYSSLVRAITQAYAQGLPTPYLGEWSQIEEELKATKPAFNTLEDAMNYSRRKL